MGRLWARRLRPDSGFTLIEMVAAMTIFAIAAGAVLTVLVTGIRTAGTARDRTLAKEVARQRLEEMRRLPYYLDFSTYVSRCPSPPTPCSAARVDLLDFYFPDLSDPDGVGPGGYASSTATYTTVWDGAVGTFNYRTLVLVRFVGERPTTKLLETMTPCGRFLSEGIACTGYTWTSDTAGKPGSNLLATEIRVLFGPGLSRSFALRSQLGEPRARKIVLQGSADGTIVQAATAFSDRSTLAARAGFSSSSIFVGDVASARNESLPADATLALEDGTTSRIQANQTVASAPPTTGPLNPSDSTPAALGHPAGGGLLSLPLSCGAVTSCVATVSAGRVENVQAATTPLATGRLILAPTGADTDDSGGVRGLTLTNQVGSDTRSLDTSKPFVSVIRKNGRSATLESSCTTTSTNVTCRAQNVSGTAPLAGLRLVPVAYTLPAGTENHLIQVELEEVRVVATAANSGSAATEIRYHGHIKYWERTGCPTLCTWTPREVHVENGTTSTLPDPSTIRLNDLGTLTLADYVLSWAARPTVTDSITDGGRSVEASVSGIFSLVTKPTNLTPGYENSGFIVTMGTLKAQAVDRR